MSKNVENEAKFGARKENCQFELKSVEIEKTEAKNLDHNEENYAANKRKSMTDDSSMEECGDGGGCSAGCNKGEHATTTTTTTTKTDTSTDNTAPASDSYKFLTPAAPSTSSTSSMKTITTTAPPPNATATTTNAASLIKKTPNDFVFGKCIGQGSFSSVYLALGRQDRREYAIKVCDKRHILRERKQVYVRREREILQVMSHTPGFVNLICTFQDNRSLYFVMTYAPNGELFPHIKRVGCFSVECARHYAAELVLACEQMHSRNVVHRDLKPENILLDTNMHTLIADFGSAKLLTTEEIAAAIATYDAPEPPATPSPSSSGHSLTNTDDCDDVFGDDNDDDAAASSNQRYRHKRKGSFVGTAQYVSPEVLQNMPIITAADLWALGCIIYHMVAGMPPFRGFNDFAIFKEILAANFEFPENFDKDAESLVRLLLKMKPTERLGARDDLSVEHAYVSIRSHEFFAGIDFEQLRQQSPPKIQPRLPISCLEDDNSAAAAAVADADAPQIDSLLNELSDKDVNSAEKQRLLEAQKTNKWHYFTDNEVILKLGLVNRHKGLFTTKLMLILTTGPLLIYVDPVEMIKKGKINWSTDLRAEIGNGRLFHVHTTQRTHFFEVLEGKADDWVAAIKKVHDLYLTRTASLPSDSSSSPLSVSPT